MLNVQRDAKPVRKPMLTNAHIGDPARDADGRVVYDMRGTIRAARLVGPGEPLTGVIEGFEKVEVSELRADGWTKVDQPAMRVAWHEPTLVLPDGTRLQDHPIVGLARGRVLTLAAEAPDGDLTALIGRRVRVRLVPKRDPQGRDTSGWERAIELLDSDPLPRPRPRPVPVAAPLRPAPRHPLPTPPPAPIAAPAECHDTEEPPASLRGSVPAEQRKPEGVPWSVWRARLRAEHGPACDDDLDALIASDTGGPR